MSKKILLSFTILLIVFLLVFGCTKKPPNVPVYNQPPETYLVNIPYYSPDSTDTIYADTTYIYHATVLFWYGTDVDGRVTRYDWAIDDTVYSENIAGSGWHSLYMDSTLATRDIIAFAAPLPDTLYTHTFYVRAVDNDEAPDPSPSHRVFNTSNIPPNTRFVSTPPDSSQRFILDTATDTWTGINFEWTAIDSDKVFPAQFLYCWDDTAADFDPVTHKGWSEPISEESFYFNGENSPYEEGYHTLYVRAIDDAGAVDQSLCDIIDVDSSVTPWDTTLYNQWRTIYFVKPEIHLNPDYRKILWINFAIQTGSTVFAKPFYHRILEDSLHVSFDSLDYNQGISGNIDHKLFGQYSTIIWSKDDGTNWSDYPLDQKQELISDFLHVGGRIVFEGSKILNMGQSFAPKTVFGVRKLFPFSELHINEYTNLSIGEQGPTGDTVISPKPADTAFVNVDATLPYLYINNNTSYSNQLWWILIRQFYIVDVLELDLWGEYNGTLDITYSINHYRDNASYENKPCATRFTYDGKPMPSFFYFGFPIAYLDYGNGANLMRAILQELDEMP